MIEVAAFRSALSVSASVVHIFELAAKILADVGGTRKPSLPVATNTGHELEERGRARQNFYKLAAAYARAMEAHNKAVLAVDIEVATDLMAAQFQEMELHAGIIWEIDQRLKDRVGLGGGIPEVGEPPWVRRLEAKIDKLSACLLGVTPPNL